MGLGNPGKEYEGTRHNIGRRIVESLEGIPLPVITTCFMNESGHEVLKLANRKHIAPEEILVVLDEFQIPLRQIRIHKSGSDGGHNGLKSVLECLNTQNVPRVRIGVGPLPKGSDPAKFVLERFSPAERKILDELFPHLEDAVTTTITQGINAAMNKYNGPWLA